MNLRNLAQKLPKISDRKYHSLAIAVVVISTIAYAILMLHRYWQFTYYFVDNVYFHTALWQLSEFKAPMVWHPLLGTINIFGDHFHPIILVVAGLLKLFPWNETVFITMAVTFGLSAYLAFLIGFTLLKSRPLTFVLALAYLLYLGTQNAMIYGFHEINFMPLFFMLAVYGLVTKRIKLYWLGFILLMLTKESMMTVGIGLGLFSIIAMPDRRKTGVLTIIFSLTWYFVATHFIIPHFLHDRFLYGTTSLPTNLPDLYKSLTDPPAKIETFKVSMLSFGLLPLLNVATLPLVIQDFFVRYVLAIPGNVQYTLSYHYGIGLDPLLFFSSVWSLKLIQDRFKKQWLMYIFAALSLIFTLYYQRFYTLKGPLLLVTNKAFYESTQNNHFLWEFLKHVPKTGTVMTQNHLGLALSRQGVYPMAHDMAELAIKNPDYIVYDLRPGQDPNNFNPFPADVVAQFTQEIIDSGSYYVYYHNSDQYILAKVQ